MLIESILERNRARLLGRDPQPLPAPAPVQLAVIACYDPRLDGPLEEALGLGKGQAIVLRVAGAVVGPTGDPLRSLALATFLFGLTEVAVIGHTSCRMAAFESAPFIDAFRARGVRREAFGDVDLRAWAGAIHDPRRGVRASVAALAAAPVLPRDLAITGLLLDDSTCGLEVVVKPGEVPAPDRMQPEASSERPSTPPTTAGPPMMAGDPPPETHGASAGDTNPSTTAAGADRGWKGGPLFDGIHQANAIRLFVSRLEATAARREALVRLRRDLAAERGLAGRLALVERFVRAAAGDARDAAAAFRQLRDRAAADQSGLSAEELIELFQQTAAKTKGRP